MTVVRDKPKMHHLNDIWQRYVLELLAKNPDWSTGYNQCASNGTRSNYYVYRPYDKFDTKLKNKRVEVINFDTFSKIVNDFFSRAKVAVVNGEVLNMKNRIGKIFMARIQRNFNKKVVNFHETKKFPLIKDEKTGELKREKIVYLIDDEWYKVIWQKTRGIKNEVYYEFKPTNGLKNGQGFVDLRASALRKSPMLKYKYIYIQQFKKVAHDI